MSFFWPTNLKADPGALARLGRVLHWIALILAAGLIWAGWSVGVSHLEYELLTWTWIMRAMGPWLVGAVLVAQLGRGLRYIFAGE